MYRYERREKQDKPVVKKMRPTIDSQPSKKRDKKNAVSAFKGKM